MTSEKVIGQLSTSRSNHERDVTASDRYNITAGRLVVPAVRCYKESDLLHLCCSVCEQLRERVDQVHFQEDLEEYCFTCKSAECIMKVASFSQFPEGVLVVVRSKEDLFNAHHDCSNLLENVLMVVSDLMPCASSVHVVSSRDLLENPLDPYIYSKEEESLAIKRQFSSLCHPRHGAEYLMTLLLSSHRREPYQNSVHDDSSATASPVNSEHPEEMISPCYLWSPRVLQEAFRLCLNDFIRYTKLEYIVPTLIQDHILTLEEGDMLLTKPEISKQITLLSLLKKKGTRAYRRLFQVMQNINEQIHEHSGHEELCQVILKKCKEIAPGRQDSGYCSLPSSMRRRSTLEDSSTHTCSMDSSGLKRSRKPHALSRVASERQVSTFAANLPSIDNPLMFPPVTSVVKAPHLPITPPPIPPLLVFAEPKAEAIPPLQLPYSPLQVGNLAATGDDAALSKTFAMHDAIGYLHEHAPGQKLEEETQAASNKQEHSTGHETSRSCAGKPKIGPADINVHPQRKRSTSSPIEISSSLTSSWVYVPRQARDTAEHCSSAVKDLSSVPPKSRSWRQGLSNAFQKLKVKIAGDEKPADSE